MLLLLQLNQRFLFAFVFFYNFCQCINDDDDIVVRRKREQNQKSCGFVRLQQYPCFRPVQHAPFNRDDTKTVNCSDRRLIVPEHWLHSKPNIDQLLRSWTITREKKMNTSTQRERERERLGERNVEKKTQYWVR